MEAFDRYVVDEWRERQKSMPGSSGHKKQTGERRAPRSKMNSQRFYRAQNAFRQFSKRRPELPPSPIESQHVTTEVRRKPKPPKSTRKNIQVHVV